MCAYCKQPGHVVSYRGCPVAKKAQQAKIKLLKAQQSKIQNQNKAAVQAKATTDIEGRMPSKQIRANW